MRLVIPAGAPAWMFEVFREIETAFGAPNRVPPILPEYTVAGLPPAANWTRGLAYVSDETGGAVIAFSDGTDWRRVTDRAVVS